MPVPENWLQFLVQIPIVTAFMLFSGWLTRLLLEYADKRERASLELLREQRSIDRDYGIRLSEATDRTVASLTDRLTGSITALSHSVERALATAREQNEALLDRFGNSVKTMDENSQNVALQMREINAQFAALARNLEIALAVFQKERPGGRIKL